MWNYNLKKYLGSESLLTLLIDKVVKDETIKIMKNIEDKIFNSFHH